MTILLRPSRANSWHSKDGSDILIALFVHGVSRNVNSLND
jgi:hypothetical protein